MTLVGDDIDLLFGEISMQIFYIFLDLDIKSLDMFAPADTVKGR